MAITNKDIEKLSVVFATKKDLENFATKQDLEKLSDKFATKDEFYNFKTEIKNQIIASQDKILKRFEDKVLVC